MVIWVRKVELFAGRMLDGCRVAYATAPSRCQDSLVVRFLRIDPMASGSNPPSAKRSLRVRRVAKISVTPGI